MPTQVLVPLQSTLFQGKMTMTYSHKRLHLIALRQWPRCRCRHHALIILSAASLKWVKPFHTMPSHSLQTQWAFLIEAEDYYLSNSIHPSARYSTPISLQILSKYVWAQAVQPVIFFPIFSLPLLLRYFTGFFVFRCLCHWLRKMELHSCRL